MSKRRVLFICTHNSDRSQMAEAFLREYGGDSFEARSAGIEPTVVSPEAIQAMAKFGIDIRDQVSKALDPFRGEAWDYVITVCDRARESCPTFPGADQTGHWAFDDPTEATGTEAERLEVYSRVAAEVARRVRVFAQVARREDLPEPTSTTL